MWVLTGQTGRSSVATESDNARVQLHGAATYIVTRTVDYEAHNLPLCHCHNSITNGCSNKCNYINVYIQHATVEGCLFCFNLGPALKRPISFICMKCHIADVNLLADITAHAIIQYCLVSDLWWRKYQWTDCWSSVQWTQLSTYLSTELKNV
jgi:hypothetical protein